MITIELQGGLGNQLFQIFTTIAYALENRSQFLLPYEKKDKFSAGGSKRPTYWDNLFHKLKGFTTNNNLRCYVFPKRSLNIIINFDKKQPIKLCCFQSPNILKTIMIT